MYNTSFIKKILLAATVVFLYSCDKDFNAIGDDLIGDDHFGLESEKYDVIAYNQEVTPIQSNSLAINALGIYDNPVFGTTTANYNTQVGLAAYGVAVGDAPVIDSVTVNIPYFSHVTGINAKTGRNDYALDSIYGSEGGFLKLGVYESKYLMRSSYYDNGNQLAQLYYNDQNSDFDTNKGTLLNDDANEFQNNKFYFSSKETTEVTKDKDGKDVKTYTSPAMRLKLNKAFFQTKILNAAKEKLSAADVFQEYFRGLYFKVERVSGSPSNMALMDFSKGKITVYYKAKTDITTDADDVKEDRTLVINLTGSNVNLFQDVKDAAYQNAISSRNMTTGDDRLYLKGGQGSLAIIELKDFGSKLEEIRKNGWLVNEANLVFTIDAAKMAVKKTDNLEAQEPKRVYLYDFTNNIPILDYSADGSSSITSDPRMSKVIYGGIINVDATTKRGTTYKIRITNHIRNIIKTATATNVKLGLVVIDDISAVTSNKLKNRILLNASTNEYFSEAPRASVMNPLGTILYGNNIPAGNADYDKRLRLEVYYTKPNK
ncbi:DUF4270 domain-containing protein [Flavobacterium panici]|uniref:DUF4270 domain-containing protein n=1 Tax=Flavobacterium panici TaxID=2654843 RepID=A0A9N8IZ46_9FLAO|nr:DUF4270 domain-containing protein [Flavobacterium panici]CAC9972479.1 hypothetical protein FLAPXU55_00155 [Flavobacterium panici]